MTLRYVGIGGSDASAGTSWATRKLTLNGAEDTPVAAGDTVYVGAGTYREMLTVDVSGSAGNPISYIRDYTGANTDGVGGVVRITGSDNDQTASRANCVTAGGTQRNYRTFTGFQGDICSSHLINADGGSTFWIIDKCALLPGPGNCVQIQGANQANMTVRNSLLRAGGVGYGIQITHTATLSNVAHAVENCIFMSGNRGVNVIRVGGITIRNSIFTGLSSAGAVRVETALAGGQTVTVNNCVLEGNTTAFQGTVVGEIVENFNSLYGNNTDRTNTNTGANSNTYPALFDARWFFEMVNGGRMVTPFDLASYSELVDVAGTSPSTTDARGTAVQGAQREWGALEYDSTLLIDKSARARFQIGLG